MTDRRRNRHANRKITIHIPHTYRIWSDDLVKSHAAMLTVQGIVSVAGLHIFLSRFHLHMGDQIQGPLFNPVIIAVSLHHLRMMPLTLMTAVKSVDLPVVPESPDRRKEVPRHHLQGLARFRRLHQRKTFQGLAGQVLRLVPGMSRA